VERTGAKATGALRRSAQAARRQIDRRHLNSRRPNHWHTLQTVWSCQAEGRVCRETLFTRQCSRRSRLWAAARKLTVIVQQGSQSRSSDSAAGGMRKIRGGPDRRRLHGTRPVLQVARYDRPNAGGTRAAGVNYDLWLGPARNTPSHGTASITTGTGSGITATAIWAIRASTSWTLRVGGLGVKYPSKVSAIGGHFMFDDDQETPNTLTATFEFDEGGKKCTMVFEVRHWISNHEAGISEKRGGEGKVYPNTIGNVFYGSRGYMAIDGYRSYKTWLGEKQEPGPSATGDGDHFANFITAVRSRKRRDLRRRSKRARLPPCSSTWRISLTGWDGQSASIPSRGPAQATKKPRRSSCGTIARRSLSRNWRKRSDAWQDTPGIPAIQFFEHVRREIETIQAPPDAAWQILVGRFEEAPPAAVHRHVSSHVGPEQDAILILCEKPERRAGLASEFVVTRREIHDQIRKAIQRGGKRRQIWWP